MTSRAADAIQVDMVSTAEIFGYVVGAVALLALPVAALKARWYLPSAQMVILEETLQNTEAVYSTIVEAGLSGVMEISLNTHLAQ